jgi:hypothetical protein
MATLLREVLAAFENTRQPLTLNQLAHELDISPGMLEGMLDYWVHKGRLREVGGERCTTCGSAGNCPFVPRMPRSYELVTGEDPPPCPSNQCCSSGRD